MDTAESLQSAADWTCFVELTQLCMTAARAHHHIPVICSCAAASDTIICTRLRLHMRVHWSLPHLGPECLALTIAHQAQTARLSDLFQHILEHLHSYPLLHCS